MSRRHLATLVLILTACCVPAPALALWPHAPGTHVTVAPTPGSQTTSRATSDGSGGLIVAWVELDAVNSVRVKRVDASGVPRWTESGVIACNVAGTRDHVSIAADGAGGAFIVWRDQRGVDQDIYAAHVDAAGTLTTPPGGAPLCTAGGSQTDPVIVNFGFGTAIAAWADPRGADFDVYAQRFGTDGTVSWTPNGVAVVTAGASQTVPALLVTPQGAIVAAWQDARSGLPDIYVQAIDPTFAAPLWTVNGVLLCGAVGIQSVPAIVTDGGEGAIVAWTDQRGADADIYARRISASGTPLWAVDGVPLCTATGAQYGVKLVSDDLGGAMAAWDDLRSGPTVHYYAQRVLGNGGVAWVTDGLPFCTTFGSRFGLQWSADATGGALAAWADDRYGSHDVFAQRVHRLGYTHWASDGVHAIGSNLTEWLPSVVPDGNGGALLVAESSAFGNPDLVAKRVDRFGEMGAEPEIVSVTDVPNDQGGQLRVAWNASALDTDPLFLNIADYQIFRSVPASAAQARLAAGARLVDAMESSEGTSLIRTVNAHGTYYWEYVGVQSAFELPGYSYIVPTTGDSIAGSNPSTVVMVRARSDNRDQYWDSAPDSGYSVDNLAPATPAPFTGHYSGGATSMAWGANSEADLAHYRLYRGTTASFVPGPGNLVATVTSTSFVDAAGLPYYYKLSAVDVHGNESPHALLATEATVDVGTDGPPAVLTLAPIVPNPVVGDIRVRFALPEAGRVRLEVIDAAGRRVALLADHRFEAGEHALAWNATDAAGQRFGTGLYFVRLEALGRTLVQRFTSLR